jgi:predicted secreted protein
MKKFFALLLVFCFLFTITINLSSCAPKATEEKAATEEEVMKDLGEEAAPAKEEASVVEEAPSEE